MKQYYVYIATNKSKTLYVGVTNNLERRMYEHKQKITPGFTSRYNISMLVYYEVTSDVYSAISREKKIKGWLRSRKIGLIESMNPEWKDLSAEILKERDSSPLAQNDMRGEGSECDAREGSE